MMTTRLIYLLLLVSPLSMAAETAMTLIWDRSPIPVNIQASTEREIHFTSQQLKVFVPTAIQDKTRVTTQNGVVFIYAHAVFPKTRIKVHDLESNMVFLLDITGVTQAHTHPLRINQADHVVSQAETMTTPIDYRVELIRYALQRFQGIERLQEPLKGVQQQAPIQKKWLNLPGIKEKSLAAYSAAQYRVEVIELNNRLSTPQTINVNTDIIGRWVSRSLYQQQLRPLGAKGDSTLLLLVSKHY